MAAKKPGAVLAAVPHPTPALLPPTRPNTLRWLSERFSSFQTAAPNTRTSNPDAAGPLT
jgi:hypothetical protein